MELGNSMNGVLIFEFFPVASVIPAGAWAVFRVWDLNSPPADAIAHLKDAVNNPLD